MIIDVLDNADRYMPLNRGFVRAFSFLARGAYKDLKPGIHEIYNDRVVAIIEEGEGRQREGAELEAHRKFVDIQYVVEGNDRIGWKRTGDCKQVSKAYDKATDKEYFGDEPDSWLPLAPGSFAIFFPEDAHMPLITEGKLRKVVIKVALDI